MRGFPRLAPPAPGHPAARSRRASPPLEVLDRPLQQLSPVVLLWLYSPLGDQVPQHQLERDASGGQMQLGKRSAPRRKVAVHVEVGQRVPIVGQGGSSEVLPAQQPIVLGLSSSQPVAVGGRVALPTGNVDLVFDEQEQRAAVQRERCDPLVLIEAGDDEVVGLWAFAQGEACVGDGPVQGRVEMVGERLRGATRRRDCRSVLFPAARRAGARPGPRRPEPLRGSAA